MLISARQAALRLGAAGVHRSQARRLLAAGFAGAPVTTAAASLYDDAVVEELAARPVLRDEELDAICPWGLFVARRELNLESPRRDQTALLCGGWEISPWTSVWIRSRIERHGHLPFVATMCGFVALGAEITGVRGDGSRRYRIDLREAGRWFEALNRHRLPTGRGREWVIRGWRPYARASTFGARPTRETPHGRIGA